jgi:hypothetical protein
VVATPPEGAPPRFSTGLQLGCATPVGEALLAHMQLALCMKERFAPDTFLWENIWPHENGRVVYNPSGRYVVRVFYHNRWRKVTIDDKVPVDAEGLALLPTSNNSTEIWPLLLGKALFKVFSGQPIADGGVLLLQALTGWCPASVPPSSCAPPVSMDASPSRAAYRDTTDDETALEDVAPRPPPPAPVLGPDAWPVQLLDATDPTIPRPCAVVAFAPAAAVARAASPDVFATDADPNATLMGAPATAAAPATPASYVLVRPQPVAASVDGAEGAAPAVSGAVVDPSDGVQRLLVANLMTSDEAVEPAVGLYARLPGPAMGGAQLWYVVVTSHCQGQCLHIVLVYCFFFVM